jgi:hypothetical protein
MPMAVVITSIQPPTAAVEAFARLEGHALIVVGDRKSPPGWRCPGARYLSPAWQRRSPFTLARRLPWNHYARKNLGYLEAVRRGAHLIAESDDDNLPQPGWGFPPFAGRYAQAPAARGFVNIYGLFSRQCIWPRGFPLERLRHPEAALRAGALAIADARVGVWQALANGDPDVDAIYRLTRGAPCTFRARPPVVLAAGTLAPFNSQNTAFRREAWPLLYLPAEVNFRVTDILRSYVAQPILWAAGLHLGFTAATVRQERNAHDLLADFASEIPLYLNARRICEVAAAAVATRRSVADNLWEAYAALVRHGLVPPAEMECLGAWLQDLAAATPRPVNTETS